MNNFVTHNGFNRKWKKAVKRSHHLVETVYRWKIEGGISGLLLWTFFNRSWVAHELDSHTRALLSLKIACAVSARKKNVSGFKAVCAIGFLYFLQLIIIGIINSCLILSSQGSSMKSFITFPETRMFKKTIGSDSSSCVGFFLSFKASLEPQVIEIKLTY